MVKKSKSYSYTKLISTDNNHFQLDGDIGSSTPNIREGKPYQILYISVYCPHSLSWHLSHWNNFQHSDEQIFYRSGLEI